MKDSIFCGIQVVENEQHFLLECPLYTDYRTILLQVCHTNIEEFTNINQEDRFVEIMKNRDDKIITALSGKYLHNSMISWVQPTLGLIQMHCQIVNVGNWKKNKP